MKTFQLKDSLELPIPIEEAWDFFSNPNNLGRIMPKEMSFKVIEGATLPLYEGQVIQYTVKPFSFFKTSWVSEINHIKKPYFFVDTQMEGPYKIWHHKHFLEATETGTKITDIVHYQPKLEQIFKFRKENIAKLFQ